MPSLALTTAGGRLRADGQATWRGGHRLDRGDGTADGIFAGWSWDGVQLAIAHDRYAMFPLFWSADATTLTMSSDLADLVTPATCALDFDALAVFFRAGFFLGDDTPFRAIRAVPPGAAVRWTDGGPRLDGAVPPAPAPAALDRDSAIDAFNAALRNRIRRHLPAADYVMPLSGGRDSRHILFELVAAGRPPAACVTIEHFPPRGNDDVAVAAVLCARLGIRHEVLRQTRSRAAAEEAKNRRTHACSDEHAQFVWLADWLAGATAETYDGIAGDVLSQSSYLNATVQRLAERGDERGLAEYVLDGYGTAVSERALATVLDPALLREIPRERALARLQREIRRHLDAPNPIASFFFWNRTRREIALSPFALMRDVHVHAPYLDRDVYDLLASLPAALELDRRLHTDAIARAFPAYADLPYETKSQPLAVPRRSRAVTRRTSLELFRAAGDARGFVRRAAIVPGLALSIVDGSAGRLWHASLTFYLAQLAALCCRDR